MHYIRLLSTPLIVATTLALATSTQAQRKTRPVLDAGDGFATTPSERLVPPPPQLVLERGINVEDHPNGYSLHASRSPVIAASCEIKSGPACAIILWASPIPPITGAEYHARVPDVVSLRGTDFDVWWSPSVHCVTWDRRRRSLYQVSSGAACMNIVDAETQELQWFVGGRIEGLKPPPPGEYVGWVPVTFTSGFQRWVVDVPVSYHRYHKEGACMLDAGGDIRISGIPFASDVDDRGGNIDITATVDTRTDVTITGNLANLCGSDGSTCGLAASTGWARITPSGSSWTFSIASASVGQEGETSADWEFHVGYYRSGMGFHIDTAFTPSFDQSENIWFDSSGEGHIFIGGNIDIPTDWEDRHNAYTGSIDVTFTCN